MAHLQNIQYTHIPTHTFLFFLFPHTPTTPFFSSSFLFSPCFFLLTNPSELSFLLTFLLPSSPSIFLPFLLASFSSITIPFPQHLCFPPPHNILLLPFLNHPISFNPALHPSSLLPPAPSSFFPTSPLYFLFLFILLPPCLCLSVKIKVIITVHLKPYNNKVCTLLGFFIIIIPF